MRSTFVGLSLLLLQSVLTAPILRPQDTFGILATWVPPAPWFLWDMPMVSPDGNSIYMLVVSPEFSANRSGIFKVDPVTLKSVGDVLEFHGAVDNFRVLNDTRAYAYSQNTATDMTLTPIDLAAWKLLPNISLPPRSPVEDGCSLHYAVNSIASLIFVSALPNWFSYLQFDLASRQWVGNYTETAGMGYHFHPTKPTMYYMIEGEISSCSVYEVLFPEHPKPIDVGAPSVPWPISRTLHNDICLEATMAFLDDGVSVLIADGGHSSLFKRRIARVEIVDLVSFTVTTPVQSLPDSCKSMGIVGASANAKYAYFAADNMWQTEHALYRVPLSPLDCANTDIMPLPETETYEQTPGPVAGKSYAYTLFNQSLVQLS